MADQAKEGLLSPFLQRKRMEIVSPYLKGNVLDFGCGSGGLASLVDKDRYLGVEVDVDSLERAKSKFTEHFFSTNLPKETHKFDTVVSLAVIEHTDDPSAFLTMLSEHLSDSPAARLIVTTPYPYVHWIHKFGSHLGLFSKHAHEQHKIYLNHHLLKIAGNNASLQLFSYARFLYGANQLAVFARCTRQ